MVNILMNDADVPDRKLFKQNKSYRFRYSAKRDVEKIYNYMYYEGCDCLIRKKEIIEKVVIEDNSNDNISVGRW